MCIRDRKLDEEVARLHLEKIGVKLTVLTDDQAAYLGVDKACLLYTSPSPRDRTRYRMPSSACKKKHQVPKIYLETQRIKTATGVQLSHPLETRLES